MNEPYIDILFDTETTGLVKPSSSDVSTQPYCVDLYMLKVERYKDGSIIKVDDLEIMMKPPIPLTDEISKIHGITNKDLEGKPSFYQVYKQIGSFVKGADRLVAHNLPFDRSILAYELARIDKVLNFPWPIDHFCTVEKTMAIEQRRMSLTNLYKHLFGSEFAGAHRAKADVDALFACYKELYRTGVFK